MFNLESLKRESGLTLDQLARLEQDARAEFPHDEMMFELHLLRILEAIQKGWLTPEDALRGHTTLESAMAR
jgi:hypothetical protein